MLFIIVDFFVFLFIYYEMWSWKDVLLKELLIDFLK